MKTTLTLLALLWLLASQAQTRATGDILSLEPYTAHIWAYDEQNRGYWLHWEPWEIAGNYLVTVSPYDRISAVFVGICSADTLAWLHVNGAPEKLKFKRAIKLDGSTYELGPPKTNPRPVGKYP